MTTFEDHRGEVQRIEREIVRYGVVLDIDWHDELGVRALAREALAWRAQDQPATTEQRAKLELFGLAQLMLKVMTESAGEDVELHGGSAWKAFGRALWQESQLG